MSVRSGERRMRAQIAGRSREGQQGALAHAAMPSSRAITLSRTVRASPSRLSRCDSCTRVHRCALRRRCSRCGGGTAAERRQRRPRRRASARGARGSSVDRRCRRTRVRVDAELGLDGAVPRARATLRARSTTTSPRRSPSAGSKTLGLRRRISRAATSATRPTPTDPYALAEEPLRSPVAVDRRTRLAEPLASQLRTMVALHEDARLVLAPVELRFERVRRGHGARPVLRARARRSAHSRRPLDRRRSRAIRRALHPRAAHLGHRRGVARPDREPLVTLASAHADRQTCRHQSR